MLLLENGMSYCHGDSPQLQQIAENAQRQPTDSVQSTGGDNRPFRKDVEGIVDIWATIYNLIYVAPFELFLSAQK